MTTLPVFMDGSGTVGGRVPDQEFVNYLSEICPIDLGDSNHRVGFRDDGNLWFVHRCAGKLQLGWIDLASGTHHQLIAKEPLHIEASVACPGGCGDHGWIRDGKWIDA